MNYMLKTVVFGETSYHFFATAAKAYEAIDAETMGGSYQLFELNQIGQGSLPTKED